MFNFNVRDWLRAYAAAFVVLAFAGPSCAQDGWPSRPVKIVIAGAAGSSGDILARLMAPKLETMWKQPVIVDNRPGAGGILGTEAVVNSTDGHTLILASSSSFLPKFTSKALRFDPFTDLQPIYKVIAYQYALITNAETAKKAKNLRDFVALSKTNPMFFSGMGTTAIFNLSMGVINKTLGMQYTAVDFNGVAAMNLALLRNDSQFLVNTPSSLTGQIETGQAVPLAVISSERYPNMPNVPTLQEAVGYTGYIPQIWAGLVGPKTMPKSVVDRIARDVLAIVTDPENKKQIEGRISGQLQRSSPAQFTKEINDEAQVMKDLFALMNFKPE